LEKSGGIAPHILKLEDDLEAHLRSLERLYDLRTATFEKHPETRKLLVMHAKQGRRNIFAGPYDRIRFQKTPDAKGLLTKAARAKIYELYAADFEAYGYGRDEPF
jgi:hypothetical protein